MALDELYVLETSDEEFLLGEVLLEQIEGLLDQLLMVIKQKVHKEEDKVTITIFFLLAQIDEVDGAGVRDDFLDPVKDDLVLL